MLHLKHLHKEFAGTPLFTDLTWHLKKGERVGLVGDNGAGKSTLMRIIAGQVEPSGGELQFAKGATVGYLPQDGIVTRGQPLFQEVLGALEELQALEEELHRLTTDLAAIPHGDPRHAILLDRFGHVQEEFRLKGGYAKESAVGNVLAGLGFAPAEWDKDCGTFSGGWQMRIALAKLLLREPTILMLDEPTNHLDIESLTWLEEYLKGYDGSVVVISHDRRFLDNLTRRTIEIANGKASEYKGNYSYYLKEREIRLEMLRASYENQQEQIRATMAFVDRFRYQATKARQVQSRLKQLDKIERIEMDDEQGSISFDFPPPPAPGRILMKLEGVTKAYGPVPVFTGLDLTLERGDRIAFLGSNGAGKSTLARIIAGLEPIHAGTRTPGHNVIISYYAQHQADELDPKKTVLETLEDAAPAGLQQGLRRLLGCFLFTGDDVFKKVKVLSGGEKSRLALAKMLLQPTNLIVMDEPTNHLDMRSKGVLQEALAEFEGSYVIVSHDRDFLDPLVNKVIEFRRGRIKTYIGNVSDYLYAKQKEAESSAPVQSGKPSGAQLPDKERKRLEAELRQRRYEKTRPVQKKIDAIEKSIEADEAEKAAIEEQMGHPDFYKDGEKVKEVTARYKELEQKLPDSYFRWNELTKQLERINEEFSSPGDGKEGGKH